MVSGSSFDVRRGDFVVPPELLEDGAEYELARFFAQRLPEGCTSITRQRRAGVTSVHWVKVRFVGWYDEDGAGPLLGGLVGAIAAADDDTEVARAGFDARDDGERLVGDLERDALGIARVGSL